MVNELTPVDQVIAEIEPATTMLGKRADKALARINASMEYRNDPRNWPRQGVKRWKGFQNELARGTYHGYDWYIAHNDMGFRCGYVKVGKNHPWFGRDFASSSFDDIDVHGGVTWSEKYTPGKPQRFSYVWWIGFDCAHAWDAPDIDIIPARQLVEWNKMDKLMEGVVMPGNILSKSTFDLLAMYGVIRTQEYVEEQCIGLCTQAIEAARVVEHELNQGESNEVSN